MGPDTYTLGAKDRWKFVTDPYSHAEMATMTWGKFTDMFRAGCVPLV